MRPDVFDSIFHYHCFEFVAKESVEDFRLFHEKHSSKVEISYHQHEHYELLFHIAGNVTFYACGNDYSLYPGDIMLIRPGELHRQVFEGEHGFDMMTVLVNPSFVEKLSTKQPNVNGFFEIVSERNSIHIHPDKDRSDSIKSAVTKLERAYNSSKGILKYDYFIEFIFMLNSLFTDSDSRLSVLRSNPKISSILDFIDNNLNHDLSLDVIADKFFISKYHLLREFTKYTGCTLHQYILQERLAMAKKLIDNGHTLDMVYKKCGFDSYSTFCNAFKKRFGIAPKKYSVKHV